MDLDRKRSRVQLEEEEDTLTLVCNRCQEEYCIEYIDALILSKEGLLRCQECNAVLRVCDRVNLFWNA